MLLARRLKRRTPTVGFVKMTVDNVSLASSAMQRTSLLNFNTSGRTVLALAHVARPLGWSIFNKVRIVLHACSAAVHGSSIMVHERKVTRVECSAALGESDVTGM